MRITTRFYAIGTNWRSKNVPFSSSNLTTKACLIHKLCFIVPPPKASLWNVGTEDRGMISRTQQGTHIDFALPNTSIFWLLCVTIDSITMFHLHAGVPIIHYISLAADCICMQVRRPATCKRMLQRRGARRRLQGHDPSRYKSGRDSPCKASMHGRQNWRVTTTRTTVVLNPNWISRTMTITTTALNKQMEKHLNY